MPTLLEQYKLEEELKRIALREAEMTRETMIEIIESFWVWSGSDTFDKDFRKSYDWMQQCLQSAVPA